MSRKREMVVGCRMSAAEAARAKAAADESEVSLSAFVRAAVLRYAEWHFSGNDAESAVTAGLSGVQPQGGT